jgi:hypothetical protein
MKVIAFIEPPQGALVEKILRHCGLWYPSSPRPPPTPTEAGHSVCDPDSDADGATPSAAQSRERVYVDMDTFWATF